MWVYELPDRRILTGKIFFQQKYDQLRKADSSTKKLSTAQKQEKYLEATAAIMSPIVESVRPLHLAKVWEDISPQFLVTFWSLSMYDLIVPVDSYQKEIQKIKQQSMSVLDSKEMVSGNRGLVFFENFQNFMSRRTHPKYAKNRNDSWH